MLLRITAWTASLGSLELSYIAATEVCVAKYPCILWALNGEVEVALVLKSTKTSSEILTTIDGYE
jgi:hypothetical protein